MRGGKNCREQRRELLAFYFIPRKGSRCNLRCSCHGEGLLVNRLVYSAGRGESKPLPHDRASKRGKEDKWPPIPVWIQEQFERSRQGQTETLDETARARHLQKAAQARWEQLAREFQQDIEDYTRQAGPTEFMSLSEFEFRVQRPPLTLAVQADLPDHRIYYSYEAEGGRAAAPDGGILSIRLSRYGRADLYSSDERLNDEEIRRMLLEPVLFPDEPSD